ncbi:CHAD domain-containing protein [bacterium]|nr:MAG: CHAD domain-containing protein [bacterium]
MGARARPCGSRPARPSSRCGHRPYAGGVGAVSQPPDAALAEWARELVERRLDDFELRRAAALERPHDVEALHDVRTRARRLRAALEDLRELVPEAEGWLRILKQLGRHTGAARDNDVLLARVEVYLRAARGTAHARLERIARRLRSRRRRLGERASEAIAQCVLAHDWGAA